MKTLFTLFLQLGLFASITTAQNINEEDFSLQLSGNTWNTPVVNRYSNGTTIYSLSKNTLAEYPKIDIVVKKLSQTITASEYSKQQMEKINLDQKVIYTQANEVLADLGGICYTAEFEGKDEVLHTRIIAHVVKDQKAFQISIESLEGEENLSQPEVLQILSGFKID